MLDLFSWLQISMMISNGTTRRKIFDTAESRLGGIMGVVDNGSLLSAR
jgi:hypothetical protein